ncbi:SDR family oxidoreductase [Aquimarina sp. RZ0]|uniref:SDR family oxidoreductase n=1 Tax=Aquimarina sp. RZ0 TaxID=2607730 RepID=UPI0011F3DF9A|nr:SDR family oxidoreductase [Aquimarina sp. RZ0]KAA1245076.1 SDR family oxidoreductase [Aquimarina sp. RZ0]
MKLNNAHVLITGGSLGIGKETAKILIQEGAKVVITGRDPARLEKTAKEIGAIPFVFDISNIADILENARKCIALLEGKIDILINNAGIGVFPKLGEITIEDFQTVYATNVFGLALLTQEISKNFIDQNYGNIINIGSTASLKGFAGGSVYASSKFALRGMTQSWQAELRKYNIRVGLINPSEVTTAFADNTERKERTDTDNKLSSTEIAHTIISSLTMSDKGFIPEVTIWATNPF